MEIDGWVSTGRCTYGPTGCSHRNYDCGAVTPGMDPLVFFLSSHSASVVCRALRWYLCREENALIRGCTQYFVSFPIIFHKGLSIDENREGWSFLVELLVHSWNNTPSEWRSKFVGTFFG